MEETFGEIAILFTSDPVGAWTCVAFGLTVFAIILNIFLSSPDDEDPTDKRSSSKKSGKLSPSPAASSPGKQSPTKKIPTVDGGISKKRDEQPITSKSSDQKPAAKSCSPSKQSTTKDAAKQKPGKSGISAKTDNKQAGTLKHRRQVKSKTSELSVVVKDTAKRKTKKKMDLDDGWIVVSTKKKSRSTLSQKAFDGKQTSGDN